MTDFSAAAPAAPYAPKPDPLLYLFERRVDIATTSDEVRAFFEEHHPGPVPVNLWDGAGSRIVRYDIPDRKPVYLEVPHGGYIRILTDPDGQYASAEVATVALADDPDFVQEPTTPDGGGLE